jgi:hypothetical protein
MKKSNSLFLNLFFVFISFSSFAGGLESLKMRGEIFLLDENSKEANIFVYDGNSLIDSTKSTKAGNFEVELLLGGRYTIEIVKEGYNIKRIAVNAEVKDPFKRVPNFDFLCELSPINESFANVPDFPATIIKMNERKGEFQYNSTYTKHISRLNEDYLIQATQKFNF